MDPTDPTAQAIKTYQEARKKLTECQSSFDLSQRRLDGDRTRLSQASDALVKAHRALLAAVGDAPEKVSS